MSDERPEESRTDDVSDSPSGGQAQDGGETAEDGIADVSQPEDAEGSEVREGAETDGGAEDQDTGAAPSDLDSGHPEQLTRSLDEARREAQAHMETALRARAELENVRRRAERDVANAHRYGMDRFVNEFLPVRDSLELGVSAAGDDADIARVREGMELTLKLMAAAFDKLGLEVVDPAGEPFDPDLHQAMSTQEGQEGQSGSVLTVVQKGYRLNERLVRPALVVVAK